MFRKKSGYSTTKKGYKIYSYLFNISIFIFALIGIISYKKSLIKCDKGVAECAKIFDFDFNYKILLKIILSGLSIVLSFICMYYKSITIFHIFYIIPVYLYFFITDTGDTFESHGGINRLILFLCIFVILFLMLVLGYLKNSLKRNRGWRTLVIILVIITALVILYYRFMGTYECENFYKGYNGHIAIHDEMYDGCKLEELKQCNLENYEGLFDLNRILGYKCRHEQNEKKTFFKHIDKNSELRKGRRFGFPNSNIIDSYSIENEVTMAKQFLKHLVDLDKHPDFEHEIEVEYDDNDQGHIKINVTRNETLVKERKKIREKNKNKLFSKNIILIFFDAISRRKLKRLHPKIFNFITKYLYEPTNNSKDKHKIFDSFEFLKFNNFEVNTAPNAIPFFLGISQNERKKKGISNVKYFKERGYITGLNIDTCAKDNWDYYFRNNSDKNKNHILEEYDHQGSVLYCDGNYLDLDYPHRKPNGVYGPLRRCIYGKNVYDYMFEYNEQFWKAYIDEPKYLKLSFNYAHEITGECSRILDEPFVNFLESWIQKGYLNDTTILFFSDHGNQISPFLELVSQDHTFEQKLAFIFLFIPHISNSFKENEYKQIKDNIYFNKDRLIVPFDIYATLIDFCFYFEKHPSKKDLEGLSLFSKIKSKRNCNNFFDLKMNNYKNCICH